ncbi:MAG: DUF4105 domain-containing protein [Spirochaetaceae bacterium]|nr:DUF4105 domain-containing protein [Spirochaetaceae bacterium]
MNYFLSEKNFYKIAFVFIIASIFTVAAQDAVPNNSLSPKITLSRSSVISMITIYPGDQIYSLFGHSAFRVYDPENGIDRMYNYGTFDFTDGFFVLKFIEGKLDYYLDIDSFQRAARYYSNNEKRKIYEQVLDFDLKQQQALFDFLEKNGEPENRVYRYDFIWDNCSTRIAYAVDKTFPGLVDYSAYKGSEESFRKMIISYLGEKPFTNFGIQLVLGKRTDRLPVGHELFFLPIYMKEAFSAAVMKNEKNETVPLILKESMIASPERAFEKKPDYPFFIFLYVLIIYFVSLVLQYLKNRSGKDSFILKLPGIVSALCEGFVFLVTGIIGLLITYLWFFSYHSVTVSNLNYLWCNPLNLMLFAGIFIKRKGFALLNKLSLVMCLAYLVCIAAGAQYPLPSFFLIVIFLIMANLKKCGKFQG